MANYSPYKNYFLFVLKRLLSFHPLRPPFLDVGCGIGDLSEFLAVRGFSGKAIDFSDSAVQKAKARLAGFPAVTVERMDVFAENGRYGLLLLLDVLEHVEDDGALLRKAASLLLPAGRILLTVPSGAHEWRWDDEAYGHLRRYTVADITRKLGEAGLEIEVLWDVSLPVFWAMRRISTALLRPPKMAQKDALTRTKESTALNPWEGLGRLGRVLSLGGPHWDLLYRLSFGLFRNRIHAGSELMILAKKES